MTELTKRDVLRGGTAMAAFSTFFGACAPSRISQASLSSNEFMDGVRIAELISNGEITALEATEQAISRAEAVNSALNAIAHEGFDDARERATSSPEGAMGGVPTFIKDLADWQGAPTLFGSRAFKGNQAREDGPLSAVWRETLGVVSLGKSTTPEMGLISSTEPLVTGPTRNPWNTDHIPGGSSGGAAALTAARVVPFAHASDGGGSIRIPAACCGLFGLKPSNRIAPIGRTNQEGSPVEISVDLAVSNTVRDSAAIFAATARSEDAREPVTGPTSRRLRIGYAPEPLSAGAELHLDTRRELDLTADLCRALGHEVKDVVMPLDGDTFSDRFLLYWAAGAAQFAQEASQFAGKPPGPDILEPWTLLLAQNFLARSGELDDAVAYLVRSQAAYHNMFDDLGVDVILTPTVSSPAPLIGTQNPAAEDMDAVMANVLGFAAFTSPMNVSGAASMSVPMGMSSDGLPIGSMFSGRKGDDRMLLGLAYELEDAKPWIDRLPQVVAT
ncbi:MAG: amidase family protein [Pseudomonadota bacterium]